MFEDDYKAVNDALSPSAEAEQRTLASMRRADRSGKKPRRISVGLRNAVAACLCLLIAAPAVFGAVKLASKPSDRTDPAEPTVIAAPAEDYSEVFAWLRPTLFDTASSGRGYIYYSSNGGEIEKSAYEGAMPTGAPTAVNGGTAYSGDHSDTNVQVEGVDESDIIKTDGRYIYVLNNEGVAVLKAEGA
ncbi:MAG: beta-propeller domain-containing protein, partial [Clostridiales bacterium]|nr:beta-propeller domain-containing protein [Clostridiales bacterium]